jgi:hypothetical protein
MERVKTGEAWYCSVYNSYVQIMIIFLSVGEVRLDTVSSKFLHHTYSDWNSEYLRSKGRDIDTDFFISVRLSWDCLWNNESSAREEER